MLSRCSSVVRIITVHLWLGHPSCFVFSYQRLPLNCNSTLNTPLVYFKKWFCLFESSGLLIFSSYSLGKKNHFFPVVKGYGVFFHYRVYREIDVVPVTSYSSYFESLTRALWLWHRNTARCPVLPAEHYTAVSQSVLKLAAKNWGIFLKICSWPKLKFNIERERWKTCSIKRWLHIPLLLFIPLVSKFS